MKNLLRIEELAMFGLSIFMFNQLSFDWWWFAVLFLAPDISFLGYLINTKFGAMLYNLVHHDRISSLSFSPDGSQICAGSHDGKIRIWLLNTGDLLKKLEGNKGALWTVTYNPSGDLIAGAGTDKIIRIWDVNSGKLIKNFEGHERDIWSLSFSPDGTLLASSGSDNSIRIYDMATGNNIKTIKEHTQAVISVAFSPDGKLLASGGDDKTVNIWDTQNWTLIRSLKGENECIYSVAFSPDNATILTAGTDKKVLGEILQYRFGYKGPIKNVSARLWDVNSGKLLHTITEHQNDIWEVCFSKNGKWIATASADHTVKIWKYLNLK